MHMHFPTNLTIFHLFHPDVYAVSSQFCCMRQVNDPVRNIQKVVYVSWHSLSLMAFRKEDLSAEILKASL